MIAHFLSRQFVIFLFVGGVAALLHWCSRIVFSWWMPFPNAVGLAYIVGMLVAFILNRVMVFPNSTHPIARQARDFVLTNLAFLPVVWVAAIGANNLLKRIGMTRNTEELAHGLAIMIPMLATFLIYKFVAFKGE